MGRLRFAFVLAVAAFCALATSAQGVNSRPMIQVSGSVVDAQGRPVPSALIQIQTPDDGTMHTAVTNGLGQFTFQLSSAGPYQATISTAFGVEQTTLEGQFPEDLVIHLKAPLSPAPTATAASPTVSLNELEAPHKAKSKLASAQKAAGKSNFAKAWKLVNEAIRIAPNWGRAYILRGALSFTQHNYPSARSDFATALAHDPGNAMALTEMGKLYSTTGNLRLSQQYLQQALQHPPVQWPTYAELAQLNLLQRKYTDAEHMATLALQCKPAPPATIHFIDGEAAYYAHDLALSAQQFRLFLSTAPKTAALAQARANAQYNLKLISGLNKSHPDVP